MAKHTTLHTIPSTAPTVAGVLTPQGRVYCPECAQRLKVEVDHTYRVGDSTDWSITCERCEEGILEPEEV